MAPKKFTLYFNPRSDITAFELATILLTMPLGPDMKPISATGINATEEEWKRVPPPLRKYFVKDSPWGTKKQKVKETVVAEPVVETAQAQDVSWTSPPPSQENKPMENKPSPQPAQPIPSFYHHEGVKSLFPEGMSVAPAPDDM